VYVADAGNNRVQVFSNDGQYLMSIGSGGAGDGQLNFPNSPKVDADFVYVPDVGNDRIAVFRRDGSFVLNWGVNGQNPAQFFRPTSVALGTDASVFIADKDNHRIQKFAPVTTPTLRTSWGAVKARFR